MDRHDIWRAEPPAREIRGELLAGVAGLLVIAAAILLLIEIAIGWHLAN